MARPSAAVTYDYVIVGAGAAGLLLANRLTENPDISVAIIDPGGDQENNTMVSDPNAWLAPNDAPPDWDYTSLPQPHAADRSVAFHAGKGLGGSTLINGMAYLRGNRAEFDAWELLGNPGWNWDSMFEAWLKIEDFIPPTKWQADAGAVYDPEYYGQGGNLHLGFNPTLNNGSLHADFRDSWGALGVPLNTEANNGTTEGFYVFPQTLDPTLNRRWDAATGFYRPIVGRENFKLLNGTATEVVWDKDSSPCTPTASGVKYQTPEGESVTVSVAKEVILTAGVFRTPLILERSGVGNPAILEKLGIETVINLPGVGENFIEQTSNPLLYASKDSASGEGYAPYVALVSASQVWGEEEAQAIGEETRPLLADWAATVASESKGALNATALEKQFEIQHDLIFKHGVTIGEVFCSGIDENLLGVFWALLPFGRGSIHLQSIDGINDPGIDPRFHLVDFDVKMQEHVGRLASKLFATAPLSDWVGEALAHVDHDAPEEEWRQYMKQSLESNAHPLGSAAMMPREMGGVVDAELKVHGARRLRVADASVMPMQLGGHLSASVYAVAQRCADMLLS
ncbi:glucose oxidase [Sarocladium strictum]